MTSPIVTLLFTDLVGSTDLYQRLGDEAAEGMRRRHFQALRDAVTALGGHEVKNIGDSLMVVFESPADAVACAVAIQQAVDRQNRSEEQELTVRVGLHVGEPIRDENDYFGTPVNIAKRLCDSAPGGRIYASDLVRGLVAPRGTFNFSSVGPIELKGISEPVTVHEVEWEPISVQSVAIPPPIETPDRLALIGRVVEFERLQSAFKIAASGTMQMVMVSGDPGIGKTRLSGDFARWAHAEGATVLFGRCDEEPLAPYQPIVEAFRHYVRAASSDDVVAITGRHAPYIAQLVPEMSERVPGLEEPVRGEPEAEQMRLYEAISSTLRALSEATPVVLLLDDLHWADGPTLSVLRHIARDLRDAKLLVVSTYREMELGRAHPLADTLADLRREEDLVHRVALRGLDVQGVTAFVEEASGETANEQILELTQSLWQTTEGNPFFVRETLRHLADTGAVTQKDGQWEVSGVDVIGLPEGVKEVIGRRLSHLTEETNQLLRVAAVIGRDFDLDILAAVGGMTEDAALLSLESGIEARVVTEAPGALDRFTFTHALVRETLLDELTTSRRVRLHRQVAEALEQLRSADIETYLAQLAYHYGEAAVSGDPAKAIEFARAAGIQAMERFAFDDAARHFRRALEGLDDLSDPMRCELLVGLGDAIWRGEGTPAARPIYMQAIELARVSGDAKMLTRAALGYGGWLAQPGTIDPVTVSLLEEALEGLGDSEPAMRSWVLSRLTNELYFFSPRSRAYELSREAISLARASGDPRALAYATWLDSWFQMTNPDIESRRVLADEVVRHGLETREGWFVAMGVGFRFHTHVAVGDMTTAAQDLEQYRLLTEEYRIRDGRFFIPLWRSMLALNEGRLDEVEELLAEVLAVGNELSHSFTANQYMAQLFGLRFAQGRLDELEPMMRTVAEVDPEIPWRAGLVLAYTEIDRMDEARAELEILARNDFRDIPFDANRLVAIACCAYAACHIGDVERARILYEMLKPWDGMAIVVGTPVLILGAAATYLGMLEATMAMWDEAEQHAAEAQEFHRRTGARTWEARTEVDWGRILLERGREDDVERAHEHLRRGLESAREMGQMSTIRMAERLLADV